MTKGDVTKNDGTKSKVTDSKKLSIFPSVLFYEIPNSWVYPQHPSKRSPPPPLGGDADTAATFIEKIVTL